MVSDVSLEMQSDSKNYVGLQDDEITEPVHTIKLACARLPWSQRLSFILYWQIFRLGASTSALRRKFPNKKKVILKESLRDQGSAWHLENLRLHQQFVCLE